MTITEHPTDTSATTLPFDLYREVHKGLRGMLFGLTTDLGAADFEDAGHRSAIVDDIRTAVALLHHHHRHEDLFIQPAIVDVDPGLAAVIDLGHVEVDEGIAVIEVETERLSLSSGMSAVATGLGLYRRVAQFTAQYIAHMAFEEGDVMEALRTAMTDDQLFALEMELRGSIAPPVMCDFIAIMVPAMNPTERMAMLGGMHLEAPAEIFELFRAAAESALGADDYQTLAAGIGIA